MAPSSASKEKKAPVSKAKKPQASAEDSSAFGPIAERFRRAGDLDRAVSLCREGLQKFPDRLSARVTLGWALLELGKYDEAQAELEQVLRQRPDNLAAIRALAELHDRAEQTLNLPMDGPGQWPPSPDAVDEVGSMVAGSFLALSGEDSGDELLNAAGQPIHTTPQPAVVPPAELGLAMWSALPATEPEPEPVQEYPGRTLFVGDAIAAAAIEADVPPVMEAPPVIDARPAMDAPAEEVHAHASGVSDADLAALLAEADSLDALADAAPAPAVAFQAMAEAADAEASFETPQTLEPELLLDEGQDLPALDELTWGVPSVETQAEPVAHEPVITAVAADVADVHVADVPDMHMHVPDAVPVESEPGFQLESLSIGVIEAMPLEAALAVEPESWVVDPDLQPILRFDLEPVAEVPPAPVAELVAEPIAELVTEPIAEPLVAEVAAFAEVEPLSLPEPAIEAMVPDAMVESVVIAETHARIAAVVSMASMARATESRTANKKKRQPASCNCRPSSTSWRACTPDAAEF